MRIIAAFAFCAVLASQAMAATSSPIQPSFDCTRAAVPVEHLICSDPGLSALDASLADGFRTVRENQDEAARADSLATQRQWLQSRLAQCGIPAHGDIDPAKTEAETTCLKAVYEDRIAALRQAAANGKPPKASVSPNVASGSAATLEKTVFPATGKTETLLNVSGFGRYSVAVKSDQGTAIQLIDRMAGPGQVQGSAGHADGRIDAFLDHGQYKVKLFSDPHGSGDAELSVLPSAELNPDPQQLVELKPVDAELGDHQQRSYWLNITSRRSVAIEASGRYLDDLRLWRDGKWLVDATPGTVTADPASGQPLTVKQLALSLEPGLYRLTAYGGEGQKWANGSTAKPLHVRFGIPKLAGAGRSWQVASSTGIDRFLVPASATYFRLDIDKPERAVLSVDPYDPSTPFAGGENRATIEKTSRDPFSEVTTDGSDEAGALQLVTVERQPGQGYRLTWFDHRNPRPLVSIPGPANAWVAMFQGGNDEDEIDPTIVVADENEIDRGVVHERVMASTAIKVDKAIDWQRRFNLLEDTSLFLDVSEPVDLSIEGDGVEAQYRVQPFAADPRHPQGYQPSGYGWQLDPGFYTLDILPKQNGKGILTLSLHTQGTAKPAKESPRQAAAMLPLSFTRSGNYEIYINSWERGRAGVRLYNSPIDLGAGITFEMAGGQTISLPVSASETGRVSATAEDGTGIPLALDGKANDLSPSVDAGRHTLALTMPGDKPRYISIAYTPKSLQGDAPLPPLDPKLLAGLPDFPPILPGKPQFLTLEKTQHASFAVPVTQPALYRLESTGIIETEGTLRTRVVPQLDQETANGTGRNFLIQRYLGEGDYQLTVDAPGESHGPIGLTLTDTPVRDEGTLQPELWARTTLAPGQAGSYGFHIDKAGKYALKTMGLGRDFTMRLEDGEGWPILLPGSPADVTQDFDPGDYRMILLPGAIENRAVTLLHRIEPSAERSGHGPFPVTFGEDLANCWLEPEPGQARSPDRWQFTLPAPAHVTIAIDSGMKAALSGADSKEDRVALSGKDWKGLLPAGKYELAVTSVAANNRVNYTLQVSSEELLAGQARSVTVPADIPVSIGDGAPVEINSYGPSDVRARLYDAGGTLVAANDDRENDWNFSIATPLAPGSYKLQVDPVGTDSATTELRMEQPAETMEATAVMDKAVTLSDPLVHVIPLPGDAKAGSLLIVEAKSAGPVGIEVEQQAGDSSWRSIGSQDGINPFIGVPLGDKPAPLRLRVWSRDHTATPVTYTVTEFEPKTADEAAILKGMPLSPVSGFDGIAALHIARPGRGVLFVEGDHSALQWSILPGTGTMHNATGQIGGEGHDIWLLDRTTGDEALKLRKPDPRDGPVALTVPAHGHGIVVPSAVPGQETAVLWKVVTRGSGQAAVSANPWDARLLAFGGPVSARVGVTVGLPGSDAALVWQPEEATRTKDLAVTLSREDFRLPDALGLSAETTDGTFAGKDAARFTLPDGDKLLSLNLPEGTAAVLTKDGKPASVIWAWEPRIFEVPTVADGLLLLYSEKGHAAYSVRMDRTAQRVPDRHDFAGTLVLDFASGSFGGQAYGLGAIDDMLVAGDMGTAITRGLATGIGGDRQPIHAFIDFRPGPMDFEQNLPAGLDDNANSIELKADTPQSLPIASVRIAAGPARLVKVHANGASILYTGMKDAEDGTPRIQPRLVEAGSDYFLLMPDGQPRDLMAIARPGSANPTMSLSVLTTTPISEGLGPKRRIAPGEARAFSFSLAEPRTVGLGVRASVDIANCYVVGPDGAQHGGRGKLLMPSLAAGTSVLVVDVPAETQPVEVEPALVGAVTPGKGPPDDVKAQYLALVNRKTEK